MLKRWLPYLAVPIVLAAIWWSPPFQRAIDRWVEVKAIEHYDEAHGDHDHAMDQVWFPPTEAVPDTIRADSVVVLSPLPGTPEADDHAHFGVQDSTGFIAEFTHFMDWLLVSDRINAIGMAIMVIGTAFAKILAMIVKALRRKN